MKNLTVCKTTFWTFLRLNYKSDGGSNKRKSSTKEFIKTLTVRRGREHLKTAFSAVKKVRQRNLVSFFTIMNQKKMSEKFYFLNGLTFTLSPSNGLAINGFFFCCGFLYSQGIIISFLYLDSPCPFYIHINIYIIKLLQFSSSPKNMPWWLWKHESMCRLLLWSPLVIHKY